MEIQKTCEDKKVTLTVSGRLDTITSPILEQELNSIEDEYTELVFDFANVEYISSACLRVLLVEKKSMPQDGTITILNANNVVKDVFKMTGFDRFINVV